ncbi:hypothetical protein [Pseudomonas sp. PH1b]|uniref:hypothetical protein n=1 Tax=Pseudomonas sp. PH1b TaxID=1397282 RepID=UPI000468A828|nr:hypothetical protein [Pseudomonas sp. PH1b]
MSQDFHGEVGQVAGGDINNYGVSFNLAGKAEPRFLVSAQRKELHELRAKCEELGDDPRDVWRAVHAQLAVTSVSEITAEQFVDARKVIQARLESLQEEADKRRLVGKILRAVAEKDAKAEMNSFCDRTFGRTHLGSLKRSELQVVLAFIQDFAVLGLQYVAPPQPGLMELRDFLVAYKWNAAGLFLFGLLVGGLWF